jgi:hypothetical protein
MPEHGPDMSGFEAQFAGNPEVSDALGEMDLRESELLPDEEGKRLGNELMDRLKTSLESSPRALVVDGFVLVRLDRDLDPDVFAQSSFDRATQVVVVAGPVPNPSNFSHWDEAAITLGYKDGWQQRFGLDRDAAPEVSVVHKDRIAEPERPLLPADAQRLSDVVAAIESSTK